MRRALPIVPAPLRRWAAIGGMRRWSAVAALAIALAAAGCGDDEDAPQVADFVPAARTPAVGQVWIVEEGVAGAFVVLSVRVRGVAQLDGADLTLTYDPVAVVFRGFAPGTLLEGTDGDVVYAVGEGTPGTLRIRVLRTDATTVSAGTDDPAVVQLHFHSGRKGAAPLAFSPGSVLTGPAGAVKTGITLFGGSLVGS